VTLSTWQLVVVGVLIAAWVVVLGGTAVVDAYRWFDGRSRRRHTRQHSSARSTPDLKAGDDTEIDRRRAVDHRRGAPTGVGRDGTGDGLGLAGRLRIRWWERPHPVAAWRAQDVVQRRIQLLLGLSVATFGSMFLAIALRGVFVRLFLLMVGVMALVLAVAAYIGAVELRHHRAQAGARRANEERSHRILDVTSPSAPILEGNDDGPITMADEGFRQTDDSEPGLIFEPLNLDEIVLELGRDRHGESWGEEILIADTGFEVPIDAELARELGIEGTVEQIETESITDIGEPPSDDDGGRDRGGGRHDATFSAAPEVGARQASARARSKKKRQARPIYIESTLDDDENQWNVANDQ
jgi:hypothetical protein